MRTAYVAGPLNGGSPWEWDDNVAYAERVALDIARNAKGWFPVCVHSMARRWYGWVPRAKALEGDIAILRGCDAVVLVSGWRYSHGTRGEIVAAKEFDVPVCETVGDLIEGRYADHDVLLSEWDDANKEDVPF